MEPTLQRPSHNSKPPLGANKQRGKDRKNCPECNRKAVKPWKGQFECALCHAKYPLDDERITSQKRKRRRPESLLPNMPLEGTHAERFAGVKPPKIDAPRPRMPRQEPKVLLTAAQVPKRYREALDAMILYFDTSPRHVLQYAIAQVLTQWAPEIAKSFEIEFPPPPSPFSFHRGAPQQEMVPRETVAPAVVRRPVAPLSQRSPFDTENLGDIPDGLLLPGSAIIHQTADRPGQLHDAFQRKERAPVNDMRPSNLPENVEEVGEEGDGKAQPLTVR
jgi:hypothetical protein